MFGVKMGVNSIKQTPTSTIRTQKNEYETGIFHSTNSKLLQFLPFLGCFYNFLQQFYLGLLNFDEFLVLVF